MTGSDPLIQIRPPTGPDAHALINDPCPWRFLPPQGGLYRLVGPWSASPGAGDTHMGFTAANLMSEALLSVRGWSKPDREWITRHFRAWSHLTWADGKREWSPGDIDWIMLGMWIRDQSLALDPMTTAPAPPVGVEKLKPHEATRAVIGSLSSLQVEPPPQAGGAKWKDVGVWMRDVGGVCHWVDSHERTRITAAPSDTFHDVFVLTICHSNPKAPPITTRVPLPVEAARHIGEILLELPHDGSWRREIA